MKDKMRSETIFLYPGYLTKGLKGKMLWHPSYPKFDNRLNDWVETGATDVSNCIFDPWPSEAGNNDCIMEVKPS
jgi:hypothetical protein